MVGEAKRSAIQDTEPNTSTDVLKHELVQLAEALPDELPEDVASEIWQSIMQLRRVAAEFTNRPVLKLPAAVESEQRSRLPHGAKRHPDELTPEEWRQMVEERAQRCMGMSAEEFVRAWNAGEIRNPDRPEVMSVLAVMSFGG
jgi:hypothetical protein